MSNRPDGEARAIAYGLPARPERLRAETTAEAGGPLAGWPPRGERRTKETARLRALRSWA